MMERRELEQTRLKEELDKRKELKKQREVARVERAVKKAETEVRRETKNMSGVFVSTDCWLRRRQECARGIR